MPSRTRVRKRETPDVVGPPDAAQPTPPAPVAPVAATLPTGPVKARPPWGGSFGTNWDRITRFSNELTAAHRKYPTVPLSVGAGMIVIESQGLVEAINCGDGTGVCSYGLMQVKTKYWQSLEPSANVMTASGGILLGFAVMAQFIKETGSWQGAIRKYHPGTDPKSGANPETYVKSVEALKAEWEAAPGTKPPPDPKPIDPWRPYPYPKMVDLIVTKPYDGAGFDRVEFRRPLIRGFSTHITDGPQTQTIEFFRDFFGTGGARATDALTDLVIGADGRIGLLNDWRDQGRGGTRAGWANGGVDGLEGPGVAFYRRFPRINVHLVSCEHAAKAGQRWTDAEIASSIEIRMAIAQELKCPWDSYPIHPAWDVSIEQAHTFFASKSCPAEPYLSTLEPIILREVKQKLRAWQTGSGHGDPLPPVEPEPVVTYTDYGFTLETVANFFGVMQRYNEDGSIDDLPFNPEGPLSLLWLERAEKTGLFPESESIQLLDSTLFDGKEWYATWEGGLVAVLPPGDTRASWMWLDEIKKGKGES